MRNTFDASTSGGSMSRQRGIDRALLIASTLCVVFSVLYALMQSAIAGLPVLGQLGLISMIFVPGTLLVLLFDLTWLATVVLIATRRDTLSRVLAIVSGAVLAGYWIAMLYSAGAGIVMGTAAFLTTLTLDLQAPTALLTGVLGLLLVSGRLRWGPRGPVEAAVGQSDGS
jgi:hypothetical protein